MYLFAFLPVVELPFVAGGRCLSSAAWASCQNDESNTAIEREMVSSLRQHSKNSSNVTTPSRFKSIFCKKKQNKRKIMHLASLAQQILVDSNSFRWVPICQVSNLYSAARTTHIFFSGEWRVDELLKAKHTTLY